MSEAGDTDDEGGAESDVLEEAEPREGNDDDEDTGLELEDAAFDSESFAAENAATEAMSAEAISPECNAAQGCWESCWVHKRFASEIPVSSGEGDESREGAASAPTAASPAASSGEGGPPRRKPSTAPNTAASSGEGKSAQSARAKPAADRAARAFYEVRSANLESRPPGGEPVECFNATVFQVCGSLGDGHHNDQPEQIPEATAEILRAIEATEGE